MNPLHPMLQGYLNHFKNEHPQASGTVLLSGDKFVHDEHFTLKGEYFVSASTLHCAVKESLHCTGPGGALISAKRVHLEGAEMVLKGCPQDYVLIMALQDLKIKATNLKIQNVALCLFYGAQLSINVTNFSEVNNVWVYNLNTNLKATLLHHWKDEKAIRKFISKKNLGVRNNPN